MVATLGLYLCDPFSDYSDTLFYDPSIGNYSGVSIVNDHDRVAWVYGTGLHTTSITTGQTVRIEETCDSKAYHGVDCHRMNNKLLLLKYTISPNDPVQHALKISSEILTMNLDGSGKQVVNIPFPD